jgi:hypothetical protein
LTHFDGNDQDNREGVDTLDYLDLDDLTQRGLLADNGSYILVVFDASQVSLESVIGTIRLNDARVLTTTMLNGKPNGIQTVLLKLDVREVGGIVLNLLRHPIIGAKGIDRRPG